MKVKVYTADGSFYEVNDPGVVVPDPADPVSEDVTTADMAAAIMEGVNDV
jgi:hypothetical protein